MNHRLSSTISSRAQRITGAILCVVAALVMSSVTPPARSATTPLSVDRASRTALHIPRGYPNGSNTGSRGQLTRRGNVTITRDGAVLEHVLVTGQVTVRAAHVVLRDVTIRTDAYYGLLDYGRHTLIEHSTIIGTPGTTLAGIAAYGGPLRARSVNVSDTEDGVRLTDHSVLVNSYVHHLAGSTSSHYDGVTADGDRFWRIHHNTIINNHGQTGAVWIGDPRFGKSEGVLSDNFLAGGGYTVYAGPSDGAGLSVVDNVWSTQLHPRSGVYGPVTGWRRSGNVWSGNTWAGGSRAGKPVRP